MALSEFKWQTMHMNHFRKYISHFRFSTLDQPAERDLCRDYINKTIPTGSRQVNITFVNGRHKHVFRMQYEIVSTCKYLKYSSYVACLKQNM